MNDAWYTSTLIQHAIVKSDGFSLAYFYSRFLFVAINIVVMKIKFSTTLKTKPFVSFILKLFVVSVQGQYFSFYRRSKKSVPNSGENNIYFVSFWCCFKSLCSSSCSWYEGITWMQVLLWNHPSSTQHTCTYALQTCSRQKANFTLFMHITSSILITKRNPSIVADAAARWIIWMLKVFQ